MSASNHRKFRKEIRTLVGDFEANSGLDIVSKIIEALPSEFRSRHVVRALMNTDTNSEIVKQYIEFRARQHYISNGQSVPIRIVRKRMGKGPEYYRMQQMARAEVKAAMEEEE